MMMKKKESMEMKEKKKKKKKEEEFMEDLPSEVCFDILSRLTVKSLAQCRSVCKAWRALIDHPSLRVTHTKRLQLDLDNHSSDHHGTVSFLFLVRPRENIGDYRLHFVDYYDDDEKEEKKENDYYWVSRPMDYPPNRDTCYNFLCSSREIIGSCNGLVCLGIYESFQKRKYGTLQLSEHVCLLNPITRECLNLPSKRTSGVTLYGFGYNTSIDQYKVVRIHPNGKIDVYTLGSGEWRTISDVRSLSFSLRTSISHGVHSYGALHWITDEGKIASFDLVTEEFHIIHPPCKDTLHVLGGRYCHLGVWRRSLCLVVCHPFRSIQIWVMKNGEQSWEHDIQIPVHSSSVPCHGKYEHRFITLSETGNVLFWCNKKTLVSYDPIKKQHSTSLDLSTDWYSFNAVLHTNSFVSMKALGEDTEIIGQVQRR